MSISRADFSSIAIEDIEALVKSDAPESLTLEYKSALYGTDRESRKEFLKDLSAFANSVGGDLVIGVEEAKGVPTGSFGLEIANCDEEIQRLVNLARDCIEPRIGSLQIKAVDAGPSQKVIVVRVPQSWGKPHRVSSGKHNQFYVRNPAGCHPASVEELRGMFLQSATISERVLLLHSDRSAFVQKGPYLNLAKKVGLIVHIFPINSDFDAPAINLASLKGSYCLSLLVSSATAMSENFNIDGFYKRAHSEGKTDAYTLLFRNGLMEAVDTSITYSDSSGIRSIDGKEIQLKLIEFLGESVSLLQDKGIRGPFAVAVSIFGANGVRLVTKTEEWTSRQKVGVELDRPTVTFPLIRIDGADDEWFQRLRPILDALWNASGEPGCPNYDSDGNWVVPD